MWMLVPRAQEGACTPGRGRGAQGSLSSVGSKWRLVVLGAAPEVLTLQVLLAVPGPASHNQVFLEDLVMTALYFVLQNTLVRGPQEAPEGDFAGKLRL